LKLSPSPGYTGRENSALFTGRCAGWRRVVFSSTGDPIRADRVQDSQRRNSIASILEVAAASLFSTLFPADCRFCRTPLIKVSRLPVCDSCLGRIRKIEGARCSVCGQPLVSGLLQQQDEPCCAQCIVAEPIFAKAVAYGPYDGGLRELIHLLKYDRVRPAANVLGRMLSEEFLELAPRFDNGEPLVVPVPLHASKLNQRGFNQSELVARAALKLAPVGRLCGDALRRTRPTETQTGLTREQRERNMRGAFRVLRRSEIQAKDILLVDDVFTTGTTVCECARVLRRAGAGRVFVATVARVLLDQTVNASLAETRDFNPQDPGPLARAARA
jgi:ComF family protein